MPTGVEMQQGNEAGRSVLLVCTRDPRGRMSGRKMVLWTIIDSLRALDHRVTVAFFGPPDASDKRPTNVALRFVSLPDPSVAERLRHALRWLVRRDLSLNESMYMGHGAEAVLRECASESGADVVVTDMLRTAPYGALLGLPWIADLDDLLSQRYWTMADTYSPETNLLGYHRSRLGRAALRIAGRLMPWVLRREAEVISAREIAVARLAQVTSLVSAAESEFLAQLAGVEVRAAPMKVTGPSDWVPIDDRPLDLVFLGGLDYGPNLRGVLDYDIKVRPLLDSSGFSGLKLHVIGHRPEVLIEFSDAIVLEGYVDDLDTAMQRFCAMLVPEVPPGGVKTKIIVAALNGTVILAHRSALHGMELTDGLDVLAWESAEDLARLLGALRDRNFDIQSMTRAARNWAETRYGPDVLVKIWQRNIVDAMSWTPPCDSSDRTL